MDVTFGSLLRRLRKRRKLTLQQVADLIGVSYPAVQQWEKDKTAPSEENVGKLKDVLGADVYMISFLLNTSLNSGAHQREGTEDEIVEGIIDEAINTFNNHQRWDAEAAELGVQSIPYHVAQNHSFHIKERRKEFLAQTSEYRFDLDLAYVFRTAITEGDHDFLLHDTPIDYVHRPSGIKFDADCFGIILPSHNMIPRFYPGELIFAHINKDINEGDFVLILSIESEKSKPRRAFIRQVVEIVGDSYLTFQFMPPMHRRFVAGENLWVLRIATTRELLAP